MINKSHEWIYACQDIWLNERIYVWINACQDIWLNERIYVWIKVWIMLEWMATACVMKCDNVWNTCVLKG